MSVKLHITRIAHFVTLRQFSNATYPLTILALILVIEQLMEGGDLNGKKHKIYCLYYVATTIDNCPLDFEMNERLIFMYTRAISVKWLSFEGGNDIDSRLP
jgi:hypothetical protein